jgi:hypothetical protein
MIKILRVKPPQFGSKKNINVPCGMHMHKIPTEIAKIDTQLGSTIVCKPSSSIWPSFGEY